MNAVAMWYVDLSIRATAIGWFSAFAVLCFLSAWAIQRNEPNAREKRLAKKRDKLLLSIRVTQKELASHAEPWSPCATRAFMKAYQVGSDVKRVGQ